ncbi:hypothetical protein CMUS01_04292 [Colletotrichum musicola]|uniref:Uncharacterized protein n=1 Tax=Colletotrichum musicola TaxID=2175873 RepID=A0A8H6KYM0_9PEZI|nr:hypothetical protein CMUS01_04292 [Colletotrichum musicola]
MALLRAADHYDPARIRDWIADEPTDTVAAGALDAEEYSLASRLLEKSGSSMVLWAERYGVVEGKLDDVLSASRTLERSLLRLLKSIGKTLSDRLIPKLVSEGEDVHERTSLLQSLTATARFTLQEGRQGSDSEDCDSDASSIFEESDMDVDWAEIGDDLRTDIECLMDLEPLIKTPFIRPQSQKRVENSMPQPESWTPEKMYSDRIGHRFPKAQLDLVARLARANWHRFQRIQSEK